MIAIDFKNVATSEYYTLKAEVVPRVGEYIYLCLKDKYGNVSNTIEGIVVKVVHIVEDGSSNAAVYYEPTRGERNG